MRPRLRLLTTGPWDVRDGDPSCPVTVSGSAVVSLLRTRSDAPGALVRLADRRYALTGPTVAVGPPSQLRRYLHRRPPRSVGHAVWLAELVRTLDAEAAEDGR